MISCKGSLKIQPLKFRGALESIQYPAFVDLKYDGELCQVMYENGKWSTLNKYGLLRTDWHKGWPDLNEDAVFYGELMYGKGLSGDLYKMLSNKKDEDKLSLKIFDIIKFAGKSFADKHLLERREGLVTLLENHPEMIVEFTVAEEKRQVYEYMYEKIDEGYEGVVVKSMHRPILSNSLPWVKLKNKDRSTFKVLNIDPIRERMEIIAEYVTPDGTSSHTVGVKLENKKKTELKVGDLVVIEHQGILSGGGLRHPVYKEKYKGGEQ